MPNFLIRSVRKEDLDDLFRLSQMVYFINLPEDRDIIASKIQISLDSFSQNLEDKFNREYLLVIEDLEEEMVIGTSMIIARHGSPKIPHMYFQLAERKHYSETIHQGFIHKVLQLKFDHDGPTEIGGLVMDRAYRGHEEKLGQQLSFARFLFMKIKRRWFKDRVLSELMPPMTSDGESLVWEALGRKFTNLSYDEADVLSRKNKEFITSLFPKGDIYTCLLDGEIRDLIGKVGKDTLPVKHMLEKIGFHWKQQIDPFDGGPHYWADTDKITLIKNTKPCSVHKKSLEKNGSFALVGQFEKDEFRAVRSSFKLDGSKVMLPDNTKKALKLGSKDRVFVMPL